MEELYYIANGYMKKNNMKELYNNWNTVMKYETINYRV